MDYTNPMAGLPDANIPNNPFWSGVNQSQREVMAQPFMDMARQGQELELQRKATETGEYTSPWASAARRSKAEFETAEAGAKQKLLGPETEKKLLELQNYMQLAPTQQKIAMVEAAQKLSTAEAGPAHAFVDMLGSMHENVKDAPPAVQKEAFDRAVKQFHDLHPGMQLPPALAQWHPNAMKDAWALSTLNQVARAKIAEDKAKAADEYKKSVDVAKIQAGAHMGAARIAADSEAKQNPGQLFARQMSVLASPVRLEAWAKQNGMDVDTARETLETQTDEYKMKQADLAAAQEAEKRFAEIIKGTVTMDDIRQGAYERYGIKRKIAKKQLNPTDQQALDWATSHPDDPRAVEIKKRLGVK